MDTLISHDRSGMQTYIIFTAQKSHLNVPPPATKRASKGWEAEIRRSGTAEDELFDGLLRRKCMFPDCKGQAAWRSFNFQLPGP